MSALRQTVAIISFSEVNTLLPEYDISSCLLNIREEITFIVHEGVTLLPDNFVTQCS